MLCYLCVPQLLACHLLDFRNTRNREPLEILPLNYRMWRQKMATLQGVSVPFVKADPDIKHVNGTGAIVNQEADLMDIPTADDDIYEDAGDLDFSNAARGLYLTRIPPYLWESWSQLDENEEIRLGTVRVEGCFDRPNRVSNEGQAPCHGWLCLRTYNSWAFSFSRM